MAGAGMIAFGIPINEFSFGNTLIISGVTSAAGGLIVVGLGAAVGQLHRIAELLAARPLAGKPARGHEPSEAAADVPVASLGRASFPPRQRSETVRESVEPGVSGDLAEQPFSSPFASALRSREAAPLRTQEPAPMLRNQEPAPMLRNPEAPQVALDDDVSLSPHQHHAGSPPSDLPPKAGSMLPGANSPDSNLEPPWRAPPREAPPPHFDSMWPVEKPPSGPTPGPSAAKPDQRPPVAPPPPAPASPAASQPRSVAILKSGVVDGMAYTLYVDGSIEAELPQGTLRFASIEDLRSHLERHS
jgi:hypothetical protein